NFAAGREQSECLAEIVRRTFSPEPGCASLAKKAFAVVTEAVLTRWCPYYSRSQVS
uniref:Uncharacterized protein n=1 Tax=Loxodonta africana TaxID=9785 RepID=G3T4N6_LOXAF